MKFYFVNNYSNKYIQTVIHFFPENSRSFPELVPKDTDVSKANNLQCFLATFTLLNCKNHDI